MSKEKFKIFLLLPWLVLILGLIISGAVWYYSDQSLLAQSETAFNSRSEEISDSVNARIKRDVYLLDPLQGFYASSDQVDRDEFETFIGTLNLQNNYPGISALYYFELVNQTNLNDFTTAVQGDVSLNPNGYPDFKVWPDTGASERLVLKYFYPDGGVSKAMGFDFLSEAERKITTEQAFTTGQPSTTSEINLVPDNIPGLNLVMPVYKNDTVPNRENAIGVLVAAIKLDQFFSVVFDEKQKELWQDFHLEVFDVAPVEIRPETEYIFDYDGDKFVAASDNLSQVFPLVLAGRSWSLKVFANHDYGLNAYEHSLPIVLLIGSLFITLLLFISLRLLVTSQQRATRQAEEMIRELKESQEKFKNIFENSADAIFIHGFSGPFLMVNKTAGERLGYSLKELLQKLPQDIDDPEFAAQVPKRIADISQTGQAIFESKHLTKDGRRIPVEISSNLIKYQGQPAILSVARDITKRKEIEADLVRRTEESERLNKSMVGRELKMIELKGEIEKLKNK